MSTAPASPAGNSPLLQLPRELRNQIYGYLLGAEVITIQCAVTKAPKSRVAVGGEIGFCEALYQKHKLTYPLAHRSTWAVPVNNLAVPADDFQLDSSTVHMTYQIDLSLRKTSPLALELQLLGVCQQLHAEVVEVFYSKKTFSFTSAFAIPAATAFLGDRSTDALGSVRSLELRLEEALGFPLLEGDYPKTNEWSVIRDTYGYYPRLCELLASRWVSLRKLSLIIESRAMYYRGTQPQTLPTMKQLFEGGYEESHTSWSNLEQSTLASWIHPLFKVTGLRALSVFWFMTSPTIQRELDTVLLMAQRMLGGRKQTEDLDELIFRSHVVSKFSHIMEGSLAWYNSDMRLLRWQEDNPEYYPDSSVLDRASDDNSQPIDAHVYHSIVQTMFERYNAFRICRFELEASDG
ncbi:hypothetical protein BU25DRAFT_413825 [Macroventuria anomochaeta]|uniref:Uncharacterized protein n=1 Tax=Macroventuria anomochaeta TaxID=301207 RepID=A0ACB6RPU7_9PLEO|nr:uncharacterized protein BU25DRAFT_413825 [Macroventuria anomochaeta]KAF2623936.1 hypothetical protein BU25DRAFT_413825 [Macroventuria anomochaeta]